jgi:hypothetical protein
LSYKDTLVMTAGLTEHCSIANQDNNFTPLVIKSIKRIHLISLYLKLTQEIATTIWVAIENTKLIYES